MSDLDSCHTEPVAPYIAISAADWTEIASTLGDRIAVARGELGLAPEVAAERSGLTPKAYARIESGRRTLDEDGRQETPNPNLRQVHAVASVVGLAVADLVDMPHLSPEGSFPPMRALTAMLDEEYDGLFEHQRGTDEWWAVYATFLGVRIRARRFQLGMTLTTLSDSIDVSIADLGMLESVDPREPINPSLYSLALVAKALSIPVVDLLPVEIM